MIWWHIKVEGLFEKKKEFSRKCGESEKDNWGWIWSKFMICIQENVRKKPTILYNKYTLIKAKKIITNCNTKRHLAKVKVDFFSSQMCVCVCPCACVHVYVHAHACTRIVSWELDSQESSPWTFCYLSSSLASQHTFQCYNLLENLWSFSQYMWKQKFGISCSFMRIWLIQQKYFLLNLQ